MTPSPPQLDRRRSSSLWAVSLLGGALFTGMFLSIAARRLDYPFPLEAVEEGMAASAVRVAHGLDLYQRPGTHWVPFVYGPVYAWLGGLGFLVVGAKLWVLRAISWLSTLGVMALSGRLAARRAGPLAGLAAAGFFAATYHLGGAWFDLARNDMLHLALALLSLDLLERGRWRSAVLAGLVAVFTKQTALPMLLGAAAGTWLVDRRAGARYGLWLAGSTAILAVVGHVLTRGWFGFFWLELPARHPYLFELAREVFLDRLVVALGGFLLLAGIAGAWRERWRADAALWGFAAAAVATSCLARLRDGGWYNVMIPAYAAITLLAAVGLGRAAVALDRPGARAALGRAALVAVVVAQFAFLLYDPRRHVPAWRHWENAEELRRALASVDGPVLAPELPFTAWRAGRPLQAHAAAVWDLHRGGGETAKEFEREFLELLSRRYYRAVLAADTTLELPDFFPRKMPAFPPGEHAHLEAPEGYQRFAWHLRADDEQLAARVFDSVNR